MKHGIYNAEQAIQAIKTTQLEYGIEDNWNLNDVISFLKGTAEQTPPRWETPEEYRERTGEPWPDNGAVYVICVRDHREFWYPKGLALVKKAGISLKSVIVATEAGPPPDDWRPEEGSKTQKVGNNS